MRFLPQFATVGLVCGVWHRDANGAEEKAASPPRNLSGESCATPAPGAAPRCAGTNTGHPNVGPLVSVPSRRGALAIKAPGNASARIDDLQPVGYSHSIHRAEVDSGCVWVLTWEGSLDALRAVPRAMRVELLEAIHHVMDPEDLFAKDVDWWRR